MLNRKREIAKFFSGFEAFHTVFHGYLLVTGAEVSVLGVAATPGWNLTGIILNGTIAIALGIYAWKA
ncbi:MULTISPECIES: hypothetical protein [unclassified Janthinobacterium]|uniref:hypothetical protein n=1 Tax=unclassified Janthinobacterium TaxID=2610881 RepID=UPI0011130A64|nr:MULTISPECIES: hypothetical protein [unclassified Janthinobacterium]